MLYVTSIQSDEEQIQSPQEDYIKAVIDVMDEVSFSFILPTCIVTPVILREKIKLIKEFNLAYHPLVFLNINQHK